MFPARASSLRSGVSSSIYNRDRRRNARQGQTFVRIAPLDPTVKTNVNMTRQSSSPPHGMPSNGGSFIQRTSPRGANETYRPEGVGGIPQQELAMRFTKLWPTSPGGSFPGPGRPSSPTSPSNIMDALSGRKRYTNFNLIPTSNLNIIAIDRFISELENLTRITLQMQLHRRYHLHRKYQ